MTAISGAPTHEPDDDSLWSRPPGPGPQRAGWGARAGAAAIDFLVRVAIVLACVAVGRFLSVLGDEPALYGVVAGIVLAAVITSFVYAPLLMARWDGQTIGHRATSTRVVMADGSRMSGGRAFVREALVKTLVIEGIGSFTFYVLTILNYLWPLWDEDNEALHDKMCGTRVVTA